MQRQPRELALSLGTVWAAQDLSGTAELAFPPDETGQQEVFEYLQRYVTGIAPYSVLMLDEALRRTLPASSSVQ